MRNGGANEPIARDEAEKRLKIRVAANTVGEIEEQAQLLLEPGVAANLLKDTRILRSQIARASSSEEVQNAFEAFLQN